MQRHLLSALLLVLIGASAGRADDWARKMFTESSHDFGTVARGAKVEYRFQFSNPYKETVHVAAVRSSCGCTTPEVTVSELKTYEKSEIVAKFNTRTFTGNHSATLTITFDKPAYEEVQLNVWGDIRSDLQVQPEQVELGTIDQGQVVDRKVTVTHSGSSDWKILDVRSVNTNYEVEVKPGSKSFGQVSYDLLVHLKKDTPPGYVKDQLILVTNDSHVTQFPIEVEGLVKAELSASPQSLALGTIESGKSATKPIVVRGRRPFKITAVHCDDESFTFKVPESAAAVQIVPVTFTAPEKSKTEKIAKTIRIETDLGKSFVVEVVAQAEVKGVEHPADVAPAKSGAAPAEKTAAGKAAPLAPAIDKTDADKAGAVKTDAGKTDGNKPAGEKATDKPKPDSTEAAPQVGSLKANSSAATRPGAPLLQNPLRDGSVRPAADSSSGV